MGVLERWRAWLAAWISSAPKQSEIQENVGADRQDNPVQDAVIETGRTPTMSYFQLTRCEATPDKITIFFSEPVNQDPSSNPGSALKAGNYTVYNPTPGSHFSSPTPLPDPSSGGPVTDIQAFGSSAVAVSFTANIFKRGDWVLITAANIKAAAPSTDTLDSSHASAAAQVNGKNALRIENVVANPTNVTVYFSDNLDTSQLGSKAGSDPTLAANYPTLQLSGNQKVIFKEPAQYDPFNRATFLELDPKSPRLEPGQWILVKVNNVASEAGPIDDGGKNTFSARVGGAGAAEGRLRREAKEVTESVEDVVAYPLLTEQVGFTGGAPTLQAGGGAAASVPSRAGLSLGQVATSAINDVLGWKANSADPKGFVGALTQAFTLQDVEGHVEATWVPRTYAVQTELGGGITGAQASLYTRAKDALDQSLPLLDRLYPLDPDADPEYVKALREMARSQMTEVVKELGSVGGPSILRVNTYFKILLGQNQISFTPPTQPEFDPDKIKGTLGQLRDTYGIYFVNNPFSNSIEDEQDITNFRVISDYMTSLLQSWISNGKFFDLSSTDANFFGTQLVLLSRQFSVIGETVNEVRFALDSVFIGPAERQTLLIRFAPQTNLPAMFFEDILREIEEFSANEAPQLLQNGGRISVRSNILPVVRSLRDMIHAARRPVNLGSLPEGYRTVRVQRALADLRDQLSELIKLAKPVEQDVPPPLQAAQVSVQSVAPNILTKNRSQTNPVPLTIIGTGFRPGASTELVGESGTIVTISSKDLSFLSGNLLVTNIDVNRLDVDTYSVVVNNPDGALPAELRDGLKVTS